MNPFMIDDINKIIFSKLNDKDFCNFITTSNKYYDHYSLFKIIDKMYNVSKIIHIREKYMFINVCYDINFWDIKYVPQNVKIILFNDSFNDELTNIRKLASLTYIYPGMSFTKQNSVNLLKHLHNYENIVMNVISNIISIHANDNYFSDTKSLHLQIYGIKFMTSTWIRIISAYIQNEKIHNYELRFSNFINTLCPNDNETFYDMVTKFDFFESKKMDDIPELSKIVLKILEYNNEYNTKLSRKYSVK